MSELVEKTHIPAWKCRKNVSFVVLDLNGTPRYMRELIPCWECSIDCYRRANSTHVSWLEFHHNVGVEIPEQVSPTIGFSPIKTHLWTCRFSVFFSWQLSLHCSPMKRFSKQTAWRLRGPAMKDGTTKIIQRLWGDAPSEPGWNSGIWKSQRQKVSLYVFWNGTCTLKNLHVKICKKSGTAVKKIKYINLLNTPVISTFGVPSGYVT